MSRESVQKIKCPKCGKENSFTIWETLNAEMSPDAKAALIDGSLFDFRCSYCDCHSKVNYPILYHDMTHRAMVYYVDEDSVDQTIQTMMDAQKTLGIDMPGYRRRIVTDQNALREKAIIFDNSLDDRVVEIIKLFYYSDASKQFPDANINAVYFLAGEGKFTLQFIGDRPLSAEVSADMYEGIKKEFSERLYESDDTESIVDLKWASDFLRG